MNRNRIVRKASSSAVLARIGILAPASAVIATATPATAAAAGCSPFVCGVGNNHNERAGRDRSRRRGGRRPTAVVAVLVGTLLMGGGAHGTAGASGSPATGRPLAPQTTKLSPARATDLDAPSATRPRLAVASAAEPVGRADPGALLWEDRVDAGGYGQFFAASATKGRTYAAGFRLGSRGRDPLVRAHDGVRGTVLWEAGPATSGDDFASGVATGGDAIFVSGTAFVAGRGYDWTLRSYDAATGALRWAATFDLAGRSDFSRGTALAVSGDRVFLGGYGTTESGDTDWVVRAYDAASGALVWMDRRDGAGRDDGVHQLTATDVSVFASGWGDTVDSGQAVVRAFDPKSGALRWQASAPGAEGFTFSNSLAADGKGVYASMQVFDEVSHRLAAAVHAYDARTGEALWQSPAAHEAQVLTDGVAVAGGRVVAVGRGGPNCDLLWGSSVSDCEAMVRSIDAVSGQTRWNQLLRLSAGDDRAARVISDGATVFVSGDVDATFLPGCCPVGRWFVQAFEHSSGTTLWRDVGGDAESGVYNMALDQNRLFVPGRAIDGDVWSPVLRGYDVRGRSGVVDPLPPIAPGQLNLAGTAGTTSFDVDFSGTLAAAVRGLVPAQVQPGNVVDDPASDINTAFGTGVGMSEHTVAVPAGTTALEIRLFDADTDGTDDLDLYVFDADFNFVGASGSFTSEEVVRIADPVPGDYHVFVHGYETDGPDSNYSLFSWLLAGDEGNLVVAVPPPGGPSGTVRLDWVGLSPGARYLGSVSFSAGSFVVPTTVLVVT